MREFFGRHRRRFARMTLVGGLLFAALVLWPRVPQDTDLEFALGPGHSDIVELRVAYLQQGEEMHGVSFGFPTGAPSLVRHTVSLPAGEFEVRCELRDREGGSRFLMRRLQTPTDGIVRIELAKAIGRRGGTAQTRRAA